MSALVVIAACLGLVWGSIFLLRGSLVVGCLGVLLTICCFGYEFLHFEPSLTLDRLLLAVVLATYIVQRSLGRNDPKSLTKADVVTLAFVGYLVVSMLASDW